MDTVSNVKGRPDQSLGIAAFKGIEEKDEPAWYLPRHFERLW